MKIIAYFKGDAVELTGGVSLMHGGLFHEGVYLEGHKKGERVWVSHENAEPYLGPSLVQVQHVKGESEGAK